MNPHQSQHQSQHQSHHQSHHQPQSINSITTVIQPTNTNAIKHINNLNLTPFQLNLRSGSKVILSGLPSDVTENQLQELFDQTVSTVKNIQLFYNQNGSSKGTVLIEFISIEAALKAHDLYHGKLIDGASVITVEIVALPAPPSLIPYSPQPTTAQTSSSTNPTSNIVLKNSSREDSNLPPTQPKPKNHVPRSKPPPPKLTLKQRIELPKPAQPRRFLFNTPTNDTHLSRSSSFSSSRKSSKKRKSFEPYSTASNRRLVSR